MGYTLYISILPYVLVQGGLMALQTVYLRSLSLTFTTLPSPSPSPSHPLPPISFQVDPKGRGASCLMVTPMQSLRKLWRRRLCFVASPLHFSASRSLRTRPALSAISPNRCTLKRASPCVWLPWEPLPIVFLPVWLVISKMSPWQWLK